MKLSLAITSLVFVLCLFAGRAHAVPVDTVNSAPDASLDGLGTGTLGGANIVTYTTLAGVRNDGITVAWVPIVMLSGVKHLQLFPSF